jgi:hypothetical protein
MHEGHMGAVFGFGSTLTPKNSIVTTKKTVKMETRVKCLPDNESAHFADPTADPPIK